MFCFNCGTFIHPKNYPTVKYPYYKCMGCGSEFNPERKPELSLKTLKAEDTEGWDEMDWADYGMKVADKLEDFEAKLLDKCKHCRYMAKEYNILVECEYKRTSKITPPFAFIWCQRIKVKDILG